MVQTPPPKVRCRQIAEADLEAVADLLLEGFPDRTRKYWTNGLARMTDRPGPAGAPRWGYVLESDGALVGVLLLLFLGETDGRPRFNVSSWYVRPAFRGFAPLLVTMTQKLKDAVYLNASPIDHSLPLLTAMGYRPLSRGQFLAAPLLSKPSAGAKVWSVSAGDAPRGGLARDEFELLRAHAELGCLSLVVETNAGLEPFVFVRRRVRYSPVGVVQLIWRRREAAYAACAGALGRALAARGAVLAISDANGPIPGLVGRYFPGKSPKYVKGPAEPAINDLAFTEAVIFGP